MENEVKEIATQTQDENLKTRIETINRMIIEVASGNYSYKIERSGLNDELEALAVMVNMMAEEIRESVMQRGRQHLNDTYKNIAGMTFVLDHDLRIQAFNDSVKRILLFDDHELQGKPLAGLLAPESKTVWANLRARLASQENPNLTVELLLKTKQGLLVPAFCSVSTLFNTSKHQQSILVTAFETVAQNKKDEEELRHAVEDSKTEYNRSGADEQQKTTFPLREGDVKKIREAHDHILQDLEDPLSLKELAHTIGLNEFKLKHGFRQLYGTTVFRFLMDERLKKASLLLQNTDIPLKTISEMTGFKSFPHFSKAFKKRFSYRPSDLKRASAKLSG